MTRARYTLALAFSALAITACGGGSDNDGDEGGTPNPCTTNPTAPGCGGGGGGGGGGSTNLAPVAEANGPYSAVVGANVAFNSSGSRDPEAGALTYSWSWGDNTANGTGESPTHAYAAAGTYRVRLTVTDDKNATGTDSATVTVTTAGTGGTATTGTLAVELTDAPFPFDTVSQTNVYIVRVDAQLAEATDAQANTGLAGDVANTDPAAGWVTVATVNRAINLLDLQNGRTTSLGQRTVPVGAYRGFRLVIDASQSNVALKGGGAATVTYPAAGRIGLRMAPEAAFNVTAGGTTTVVADFDVGKSFRLTGATIGGGLTFASAVRALQPSRAKIPGRYRVESASGTINVAGASLELLPAGTAINDTDPSKVIATTATDASGQFLFRFVTLNASYVVRATPPASRSSLPVRVVPVTAETVDNPTTATTSRAGMVDILIPAPR